ncbi:MAG: preprotein translocase subunit YajC [Flavobacteriales bacterium]|nr:preprotein translocase subunit YajC [Flavobacteriales bacterium]MBH69751.1 preprotein translocase subunit YajC [Flavobacteriales bacterium]MBO98218.1 preprotein translocase subunit YajC [Flavobacteriales bacterium]|tara:strand:+ start:6575 stop:6868 length:294 start_codon:yes stop_codon:yes gene_type:complete
MILLQVSSGTSSLIMMGLIFIVFYFFMIRPQIKKQKKESEYRKSLKKGDKIISVGGIHGKIIDIKNDTFVIEVQGGTQLRIEKNAVAMNGTKEISLK